MRQMIAGICRDCGAHVVECSNGIEAVESFQKHRPDCSLIDFEMPEMDGLEATARIRSLSRCARIFIVTQYDNESLRQAAAGAGANGFVRKEDLHMLPDLLKAEKLLQTFALPAWSE